MLIPANEITRLTALRHRLHMAPEASREERQTAKIIAGELRALSPDLLITDMGGHGVAAIFDSGIAGPTLMFRSELDGLPIEDLGQVPYRSQVKGRGHLCGHDGHSVTLLALASELSRRHPAKGRVVTLFQPAEEDGSGAAAIIANPHYAALRPDFVFAWHNLPGMPFGHVAVAPGPANCASRGMVVRFKGRTAHASMPKTGNSPMPALAMLMPQLAALSRGMPPAGDFRLATVTHANMGEPVFGIAPADATLFVTLRTLLDSGMAALVEDAEALAHSAAEHYGLAISITYEDVFVHCENAPQAVAAIRAALNALNIPHDERGLPIRASEDFGRFGHVFNGHKPHSAMFYLGAGQDVPQLHNPEYDYADALTPIAASVFITIARDMLG